MSTQPKLRTPLDRLRQVLMFEVGGLVLITPPFVWLAEVPLLDSLGLLAVLAAIAGVWNAIYNTVFDWVEGRMTGRAADQRGTKMRLVQAMGYEGGLLFVTWPVVVMWTGMGWWQALMADIALAAAYTVYAYFFNLGYDRLFPISESP